MIVFFFSLWMTVSLGQQSNDDCLQRYTQCAQQTLSVKGTDRCRTTNAFMECVTDVTSQCYPELVDAVTDYHNLIQEGCSPDSTLINDVMVTGQCISTNIQQFQHCRLEGEFETLAELCSSIGHLTECLRLKTESLCSMKYGKVFQRVFKPITELTGTCERSQANKAYILPECDRALLRCSRDIVNPKGFGCSDVEMKVTCYMEAANNDCDKKTVGPYLPILERYVAQIPQYCNPESAFRKNLGKSYSCILENLSVILPCHDVHRDNLKKVVTDSHDDSNELVMAIIRANLQHYDCIIEKLGAACGKEAEYVTRYMLSPVESTMEERCKELTGEKCNGSAASGCSFVLLILSLAYILTKEDERI